MRITKTSAPAPANPWFSNLIRLRKKKAGHKLTDSSCHVLSEMNQESSSGKIDTGFHHLTGLQLTGSLNTCIVAMSEKGLEDEAKAGLELSGIWPAAVSNGEAKIEENTLELEQLDVELSSASMTESSEGETGKTAVIRQIKVNSTRPGSDKEGRKSDDEKLYVVGNFSVCCGYSETMDDREFADEGIYQGLVMTDTQKKELGILPEAIYMTIKLIEKGALIESLALSAAASAIEVAEASPSTNLSPIFDKQDMNLIGLDNPRPRSKYCIIIFTMVMAAILEYRCPAVSRKSSHVGKHCLCVVFKQA